MAGRPIQGDGFQNRNSLGGRHSNKERWLEPAALLTSVAVRKHIRLCTTPKPPQPREAEIVALAVERCALLTR